MVNGFAMLHKIVMSGNVKEGQEISPSLHLLGLLTNTLQLYECETREETLDTVTNMYWHLGLLCTAMKMEFNPKTVKVPDSLPNYLLDIRDIYMRVSIIGGYVTSYNLFAVPIDIINVKNTLQEITLSMKNILSSTKITITEVYNHIDNIHPEVRTDYKESEKKIERIRQQIRRFDKSPLSVYNNLDDAAVAALVVDSITKFNPRLKRYMPVRQYVKKLRRVCELFCVYVNGDYKKRPKRNRKRNKISQDRYRGLIP